VGYEYFVCKKTVAVVVVVVVVVVVYLYVLTMSTVVPALEFSMILPVYEA